MICLPGPGDRCPNGYLCQYSYSKRQHQCCSEPNFGSTTVPFFPLPTSPSYPGGSFKNESFPRGINEEYDWSGSVLNTYWGNRNNSATMATTIDCPPEATNRKCASDEADVGGCCLPSKRSWDFGIVGFLDRGIFGIFGFISIGICILMHFLNFKNDSCLTLNHLILFSIQRLFELLIMIAFVIRFVCKIKRL